MSLNKVILIGNVGKDPDVRYFDSGAAVANFPLATSERGYTLANGTVVPERTEWHNIVVRRDLVPFVEKWVRKGSGVYVEGKIRTRNYDDQSGVKRYVTEIHADRIEFTVRVPVRPMVEIRLHKAVVCSPMWGKDNRLNRLRRQIPLINSQPPRSLAHSQNPVTRMISRSDIV